MIGDKKKKKVIEPSQILKKYVVEGTIVEAYSSKEAVEKYFKNLTKKEND